MIRAKPLNQILDTNTCLTEAELNYFDASSMGVEAGPFPI